MSVWKLKGCPRCGGDLHIENDLDGWYESCLQCSYQRDIVTALVPQQIYSPITSIMPKSKREGFRHG